MKNNIVIVNNIHKFRYDKGVLFWSSDYAPRARKDNKVGSLDSSGYLQVHLDSACVLVHRIIWYMFHGDFPDQVDHVDRNRLNNNIENLRASNNTHNQQNASLRKDNKTGQTGVCMKNDKYVARISSNGKRYNLGTFTTLEDAIVAYKNAKVIYHIPTE